MEHALRAVLAVGEALGLPIGTPAILRDGSNLLVRLDPAPVVARVARITASARSGDAWLAREIEVAGRLAAAGAPVVAPSRTADPGPHSHDGFVLTLWERETETGAPVDAPAAGRGLRACHTVLADLKIALPQATLVDEAAAIATRLEHAGALAEADAALLARIGRTVRARLAGLDLPRRPVHGDAHLGNVLMTPRGPLWNDWEDTFLGPVAWDLACLHASAPPFGTRDPEAIAAAADAYGDAPGADALDTLVAARRYQAMVWTAVFALARPGGAPLSAQLERLARAAGF